MFFIILSIIAYFLFATFNSGILMGVYFVLAWLIRMSIKKIKIKHLNKKMEPIIHEYEEIYGEMDSGINFLEEISNIGSKIENYYKKNMYWFGAKEGITGSLMGKGISAVAKSFSDGISNITKSQHQIEMEKQIKYYLSLMEKEQEYYSACISGVLLVSGFLGWLTF